MWKKDTDLILSTEQRKTAKMLPVLNCLHKITN